MFVDDHLLTGKKTYKRQKRTSQLNEYFDSLYDDKLAASSSPDLYKLLQDPHRWWTEKDAKPNVQLADDDLYTSHLPN
ncbi:hypothetical protein DPSP01_014459 [Paraphaeosphaeria sporulosa]